MQHTELEDFDYSVECEDFLLYELGRLIEEDRASFEDEEFGRLIEAGIHEHIERRLDIRAEMARRLRASKSPSGRLLHSLEDIEARLTEIPEIIHHYTAYLFRRLEECASRDPDERVVAAADALFDSPEDRHTVNAALDTLGSIPSTVSARVLAHAISEPMLDEEMETKAYRYVRAMWPAPRHYILYSLKPHSHEDIPFRWFQLLIDRDEPSAVDRILEEVLVHGADPNYREDLFALIELLEQARDPETVDKVVQVINSEETPRSTKKMLEDFLRQSNNADRAAIDSGQDGPWARSSRAYAANKKYLAAARLLDSGKRAAAGQALDELLKEEPQYPFALMLKSLV